MLTCHSNSYLAQYLTLMKHEEGKRIKLRKVPSGLEYRGREVRKIVSPLRCCTSSCSEKSKITIFNLKYSFLRNNLSTY